MCVVKYKNDNTIQLNSGDWQTMTTKKTINNLLPGGIFIKGFGKNWSVQDTISQKVIPYEDGMILTLPPEVHSQD
jgi:hypothetical protein